MYLKLPVDTIGLHGEVYSLCERKKRINLEDLKANPALSNPRYYENKVVFALVCPNGYTRKLIYFKEGGTVTLEIALPNLVHPNNATLLTLPEAIEAIQALSEHTGLNLMEMYLSRVDVTNDIAFNPSSLKAVRGHLKQPAHWRQPKRKDYDDSDNFSFGTTPIPVNGNKEKLRSAKQITFYAKKGKTRIEIKHFSAKVIKSNLGQGRKMRLKHLLTREFIAHANNYYAKIAIHMTSKNKNPMAKCLQKAALAVLPVGEWCFMLRMPTETILKRYFQPKHSVKVL